jgi:hypothetical protein
MKFSLRRKKADKEKKEAAQKCLDESPEEATAEEEDPATLEEKRLVEADKQGIPTEVDVKEEQAGSEGEDELIDSDDYLEEEGEEDGSEGTGGSVEEDEEEAEEEDKEAAIAAQSSSFLTKLAICGMCFGGAAALSEVGKTASAAFSHEKEEALENANDLALDLVESKQESKTLELEDIDEVKGHLDAQAEETDEAKPVEEEEQEEEDASIAEATSPEEKAVSKKRPNLGGCLFGLFHRKPKTTASAKAARKGPFWRSKNAQAAAATTGGDGMVRYMSHKERVERGFEVLHDDYDQYRQKQGEAPMRDYKYEGPAAQASKDAMEKIDEEAEAPSDESAADTASKEDLRDHTEEAEDEQAEARDENLGQAQKEAPIEPINSHLSATSAKSKGSRFSMSSFLRRKKKVDTPLVQATSAPQSEAEMDVAASKEDDAHHSMAEEDHSLVHPPMGSALRAASE